MRPDENLSYFYEYKPNSRFEFNSFGFEGKFDDVYLNNDGLNESVEYPVEKIPATFRIITLGSSSTFGWFVKTSENYPEQLEVKLNNSLSCPGIKKFEVINLGVGGYDIEYAVHRYKLRGQKYDPDLVLWLVQSNNLDEIADYITSAGEENYKKIVKEGRLDFYRQLGIRANPGRYEAKRQLQKKMGQQGILSYQMEKLYSFNSLYNKKLVMFTFESIFPEARESLVKFSKDRPQTWFYDSIPALQPEEAFPDGHPTAKGYTKIVNDLFEYIKSNDILPCN